MRTWVYCLLTAPAEPPAGLAGVDDLPVRRVAAGAVDAWVTDAPPVPNDPSRLVARARAHDAVSAAALDGGTTPLPARFGQTYASDDACARALAARADTLAAGLARVAGLVEMAVIVPVAEAAALAEGASEHEEATSPGRAYLARVRRRLAPEMRFLRSAVRRRITETVGALVRDEAVAVTPSSPAAPRFPAVRVAHLVPRHQADEYRARLLALSERLAADDARARLSVFGPAAPYSFTEPPAHAE